MDKSLVTDNTSDVDGHGGGGIWSSSNVANLHILSSKITGNMSLGGGQGGGVLATHRLLIYDSLVAQNSATSNGAGIRINARTTAEISNSTVANNRGSQGAGIYLSGELESTITITSSTIVGNMATRSGGGLFSTEHSSRVTVSNTLIMGNEQTDLIGNRVADDVDAEFGLTATAMVWLVSTLAHLNCRSTVRLL